MGVQIVVAHFFISPIKKALLINKDKQGFRELRLGIDLLSHGETPHYHRRCTVSLLSSRGDQVVPVLYGCQTNWLAVALAT